MRPDAAGRPMDPAVLARLRPVPPDVACYDTDLATAASLLRVEPQDLTALAAAGLPHRDDPVRGTLFDYTDLINVAYLSGTGRSVPELAWRFLLRFAESPPASWYQPLTWLVRVRPPPLAGALGRPVRLAVPDLDAQGVERLHPGGPAAPAEPAPSVPAGYQGGAYQVLVRLTGSADRVRDPAVRAAYDEVVDAMVSGEVAYQAVAEPLRADHARAWALGVADCAVASKVLADRLRALGLPARTRRGFLLGLLGSDHVWCEVEEEGRVKVLDPVFARLTARTGAAAALREACCGGRFNRLLPCAVPDAAPLITGSGGEPLPLWALAAVSAQLWRKD